MTWPVAENLPSRRHPRRRRSCRRASPPSSRARRATSRPAIAAALDYAACCASSFSSSTRRRAGRQRDGAASAQQRPLHDRRLRHARSSSSRCARWPACRSARTRQHRPAVMLNLLGDLWFDATATRARRASPTGRAVLRIRGASCTCTARPSARRGRKMGHVTCLGATLERGARGGARDPRDARHPRRRPAATL